MLLLRLLYTSDTVTPTTTWTKQQKIDPHSKGRELLTTYGIYFESQSACSKMALSNEIKPKTIKFHLSKIKIINSNSNSNIIITFLVEQE